MAEFLDANGLSYLWRQISTISVPIWNDERTPGEFYKNSDAPTSTDVGKFDGYFYATRVYNAVYNDYAELFEAAEPVQVGRVAFMGKDGLVRPDGTVPVGIVSDRYAHLIGGIGDPDDPHWCAVALAGRVPVEGTAALGDMLCACKDGTVRPASVNDFGRIVGRCVGFENGKPMCLVGVM